MDEIDKKSRWLMDSTDMGVKSSSHGVQWILKPENWSPLGFATIHFGG